MEKKIKILLKKVGKRTELLEVENKLETWNELVAGFIQVISVDENVLLVCNDDGKILNLPINIFRIWDEKVIDCINGNFFLASAESEDFASLSPELIERWIKKIDEPEFFVRVDNGAVFGAVEF